MQEQEELVAPSLIRWGAAFGGAVFTIAATLVVMLLWIAIGDGSGVGFFVRDLHWFFLGTALGAIFVGGVVAGRVSGVQGARSAFFTGVTVWALVLVAVLAPFTWRVLGHTSSASQAATTSKNLLGATGGDMWAFFAALAGGLVCAVVGTAVGAIPRRRRVHARSGHVTDATFTTSEPRPVVR